MFNNWQLPDRIEQMYAAPICQSANYNNCVPWAKKGARINFQYTWDVDRLNNCGGNAGSFYEGKRCGNGPVGSSIGGLTPSQLMNIEDYDIMQMKNMQQPPNGDGSTACANLGMYTDYRGRCDLYSAYMNQYNPVNGI